MKYWQPERALILRPLSSGEPSCLRSWHRAMRERPWASRQRPQPGFARPALARSLRPVPARASLATRVPPSGAKHCLDAGPDGLSLAQP